MHLDWIDIAGGIAILIGALGGVAFAGVKLGAALARRNGKSAPPQPSEHPSGECPSLATTDAVDRAIEKAEDRIEARLASLEASSGRRFDRLEEQVGDIGRSIARLEGRLGEPAR